ncbi:hypothetical protein FRB96_006075 [Tulasnella sp. 330]|nr:hypothetical protein FRB96_006075 [Tulasnella sp. 330]KAG8875905.1 hypothetical protein FRB97_004641 [Tulasnella sp. 331]KAG8889530.1 hypothetical protein FRB98_004004 [Tulasnella sp. 332]
MQTVSKIAQRKKAKRGGAPQQQNTTVSPGPTTSASTTSSTTTTTKPVRTTPMYGTGPTSILSTMPAPITGPTTAEQLGSGPTPIPVKDLLSLYGLSGFSPPSGAFESRAETTQQQSHNSQHRSSSASSVSASNTTVSPITPVQPQQQQSPFLPSEASWANMLLDNSGNDAPSPATQFMNMMEGVAKTTPAMDTNAATASNSMEGLMSSAGMFNAQADWSSFVFGSTPSDK